MKKLVYLAAIVITTMGVSNGFAQDMMKSDGKMQMSGKKSPDSKFMMMAATSDMNEITLSNQALSKTSNEAVKMLAQMMITDHTKSSEELKPIAMSKNVMLPTDADAKHKAAAEKMSAMSGSKFDMEYVKMMVKDHEKTVALFNKEIAGGKDADAKAFAQKTLPVVQGHLDMARKMMSDMMGGKKMDGGKMSGM